MCHRFRFWFFLTVALSALFSIARANDQVKMSEPDYGFDRQGGDYRDFVPLTSDPTLCEEACAAETRCVAWAYNKPHSFKGSDPRCFLKDAAPSKQAVPHAVSGTKITAGENGLQ